MKLGDLKVGDHVVDRWWPWALGRIEWVGRTRVRVWFFSGCAPRRATYDVPHLRFLEAA